MCLGIPGKVVETDCEDDVLMGKVEFGGISRRVCLAHVPEARPGTTSSCMSDLPSHSSTNRRRAGSSRFWSR